MFLPEYQVRFFPSGSDLVLNLDSLADQENDKPRIIILDFDITDRNAFQTLVGLKHHDYWQPVPVIMMTSRDQAEFRIESLRLGASAFLFKPMNLPEIKQVMTKICHHQGDFTTLFQL